MKEQDRKRYKKAGINVDDPLVMRTLLAIGTRTTDRRLKQACGEVILDSLTPEDKPNGKKKR